jgi:hypothetical protein
MTAQLHICGVCNRKFGSDEEYTTHVCRDNYTPADIEHQGEAFATISAAALKRGEAQKTE